MHAHVHPESDTYLPWQLARFYNIWNDFFFQTATALQVKGLAEVPADEFKRVSLGGRCASPVENSSPAPVSRTQAPPPLIMSASSVRSWPSGAEPSENMNDFPARKKLKKSASANIPYNSGSSSTNGMCNGFFLYHFLFWKVFYNGFGPILILQETPQIQLEVLLNLA